MSLKPASPLLLLLVRWSCVLVFLGRAWQHLIWDAPLRAFFWDESLLGGLITGLTNMEWQEYVTSPRIDGFINGVTRALGVFYLGMALVTIQVEARFRRIAWLYPLAAGLLTILALLYWKEKSYHAAQFFEYAIQVICPITLYLMLFTEVSVKRVILLLKIAIACTFMAHGLYALGVYPRPGVFIDMTIHILGVTEAGANQFLTIAGILDFVVGIGIFIPKVRGGCLMYAAFWGFVTALARVVANVEVGPDFWTLLTQYLPQTIYRLPHGLIPLAVWLAARAMKQVSTQDARTQPVA